MDQQLSFTIRYQGQSKVVTCRKAANCTINDLAEAIQHLLDIPAKKQKLITQGMPLIKPSKPSDLTIPLDTLANKKIILIGLPDKYHINLNPSAITIQGNHLGKSQLYQAALTTYQTRLQHSLSIIGTAGPLPPVSPGEKVPGLSPAEEESLRKQYGRLFRPTPREDTLRARLEALIGTGIIPRMHCTHLRDADSDAQETGCFPCRQTYITAWYVFTTHELHHHYRRTHNMYSDHPTPSHGDDVLLYREEMTLLVKEWNFGYDFKVGGALSECIEWFREELELDREDIWVGNEDVDGVQGDLKSFDLVRWVLDGGVEGGCLQGLDGEGVVKGMGGEGVERLVGWGKFSFRAA